MGLSSLDYLIELYPYKNLNIKYTVDNFYHGLCLKGKPWSCGHPLGWSLTISLNRQEQTCLQGLQLE